MKFFLLTIFLFAICLIANAQPSQAPLQNFISAGGGTGSVHSSTSIPTHFSSVGQPAVMARPTSTTNGGGVMNANEFMFAADLTAPLVTDNTSSTVNSGSDITISVTITDSESAITAATVSYRAIVVGGSLVTKDLTKSGSTYTWQIATADIGELGIVYKLSATSTGGTTADASFKLVKVSISDMTVPYTSFGSDVSNYRIVALPVSLGASSVNSVFADDLGSSDKSKWRMFRYDDGTTSELSGSTSIDPGNGYWLIVKSSATIDTGPGTTVLTTSDAPFEIDLKADWNEIGNPYNFAISWADVQAANPGLPGLRTYDGDFVDDTKLNKLEGGFVKVTSTQKLKFPVVKNPAVQGGRISDEVKRLNNPIDQPNWQVYFTIQQENLNNRISGFGMNKKAVEGFDILDGFNMPPFFENFIELRHAKKVGNDFYSSDIVPTSDQYVWEFNIESTKDQQPITLRWDNSYFGSNDRELYLWDEALKRAINMRMMDTYTFQKNISKFFKVIYGDESFVKEKIDVHHLVVHAIWPNPVNQEAAISFSLPQSPSLEKVEFEIVDLLGRKIWNHQSEFSSGYHEVVWKRLNDQSDGVYFIRLTSGGTSELRRLVLK